MPSIDIGADASRAVNEAGKFGNALDSMTNRFQKLISVQETFNRSGTLVNSTVKGQVDAFTTLEATINRFGRVTSTTYTRNEAAARKAAEAQYNADAQTFAKSQALRDKRKAESDRELAESIARAKKQQEIQERTVSFFDSALRRFSRNLVQFAEYRFFNNVTSQLQQGIDLAKDFQIQISLIRTISQDSQQTFGQFGRDIRGVSDRSGLDLRQVGKAFYDTISNQIAKGADVAPFVETATKLAKVTGSEVTDAVNLLSSAINAYGLSSRDAEKLSAQFFRTIDEGRVVASELANTFGRVAVIGQNLGVSIEDLQAVIAITTQKGFKTADSLTLLTNLLIKLEKPTEATAGFFRSLGVDSGEAAIQLLGFTGVLRKMVEAVQSGQVDVSAFFDEIRGRKQFGVFQQSIDQIDRFSNSLKNTAETAQLFNSAVAIRGESPAQKLVEEFNKLRNVFTVDLGQNILQFSANTLQALGGVDALTGAAKNFTKSVELGIVGLVTYRIAVRAVGIESAIASSSLTALGVSLARVTAFLIPVTAAIGTYLVATKLFGTRNEELFKGIDTTKFETSIQLLENYKKRVAALTTQPVTENLFKGIDDQKKVVEDTFKSILQLIANANIANNKFLDEARQKSKDVSEALRISFSSWTDQLKNAISEIGKQITEAKNEIEKSSKSTIAFGKTLSDTIFNTKFKFATDAFGGTENQKVQLLNERIKELTERSKKLFETGDPQNITEARQILNDIVKLEEQRFDLRTEAQKKQFDAGLRSGAIQPNQFGPNVFTVQTIELQQRLNALKQLETRLETEYQDKLKQRIELKQKEEVAETERLRKLEVAFKALVDLDPFSKTGAVKPEFKDQTGKFDQSKLLAELEKREAQIRANAGGTFEQRFQLELQLAENRRRLVQLANAEERKEYLNTIQTKNQADKERFDKELERIKQGKQAVIDSQNKVIVELQNKTAELEGFANKLTSGNTIAKGVSSALTDSIKAYGRLIEDIKNNPIAGPDGIPILDPEKLNRAEITYKKIVKTILGLRGQSGSSLEIAPGLDPASGITALEETINKAKKVAADLETLRNREAATKGLFDLNIVGPFDALKAQFPDLATTAATAFDGINAKVKNLATDGLEQLKQKLLELQKLMQNVGGGPNNVSANFNGDATYAATGGIVGLFPGQPRGQDVYPIWAAKGETIISAATSRMYKPMLQAIMSRQMPRYMSQGGVVGGDTNVGDINISVQGATTNNETARVIGNQLERQLRRRNIRL